jgi:acyl-CoA synthetase (AMP-forming)/AMP-acid ligase II
MRELTPLPPAHATLNALVSHWAAQQPDAEAFLFLGAENVEQERLSYAQLASASRGLARMLLAQAAPAARILLMFEPGLAFVVAFFACHRAGMVPVPVVPARRGRMRDAAIAVASDCAPALLLCTAGQAAAVRDALGGVEALRALPVVETDVGSALAADASGAGASGAGASGIGAAPIDAPLAFLQYTSGSTSTPKGVMVSQANLFANLEMQRLAIHNPWGACYVGWTPLYHDMGLIANLLEPFYLGGRCVLMSPAQMAQAPWLWLRAISHYRAHSSGGSNFAYDLCIERAARILAEPLDLSCWKVAFSSAEPVRADTLARFHAAFAALGYDGRSAYPCYGLAEATLVVSCGGSRPRPVLLDASRSALEQGRITPPRSDDDTRTLVGCGAPVSGGEVAIVDPDTRRALTPGRIGEIWVRGPHVPTGYWNNPAASAETFHAVIDGDPDTRPHLRTGDLGFVDESGEVYVTGRRKDLLIVRGRNLYPQDLERAAQRAYAGLGEAAAFPLDADRIGLVIEVAREQRRHFDRLRATAAVRAAVLQEFEVSLHAVRFVAPGSVPLTSSGKIRRRETQRRFLADTLRDVSADAHA